MKDNFIKEIENAPTEKTNTHNDLLKNLDRMKQNLESDYNNLQYIKDPNLVDYYTYKIKSDEAQYNYLLQKAKKEEL